MAKFYGAVGFTTNEETSPGIWEGVSTERKYSGNVIKNTNKWRSGEHLNDDIVINNRISIVADPYAFDNFFAMQYVCWMGVNWKIKNVEIERPRIILSIGGVHNG